jgi:hypothetical protein
MYLILDIFYTMILNNLILDNNTFNIKYIYETQYNTITYCEIFLYF